jgi:hypothetical protein
MLKACQIANVKFEMTDPSLKWPDPIFDEFSVGKCHFPWAADWKMTKMTETISEEDCQLIFETEGSWSAYTYENKILLRQFEKFPGKKRRARGHLLIDSKAKEVQLSGEFEYPFDELLFLYIFSKVNSLLVHSCAVEYKGQGYLFCGVSGAGKSTLSEYLRDELNLNVLCDERNVLSINSRGVQLSSSPWYGTSEISKPMTLPLTQLFILDPKHMGNGITPLDHLEAYRRLYQVVFFPQFDKEAFLNTHIAFEDLLKKIEVKELSYNINSSSLRSLFLDQVFSNKVAAQEHCQSQSRDSLEL